MLQSPSGARTTSLCIIQSQSDRAVLSSKRSKIRMESQVVYLQHSLPYSIPTYWKPRSEQNAVQSSSLKLFASLKEAPRRTRATEESLWEVKLDAVIHNIADHLRETAQRRVRPDYNRRYGGSSGSSGELEVVVSVKNLPETAHEAYAHRDSRQSNDGNTGEHGWVGIPARRASPFIPQTLTLAFQIHLLRTLRF